MGEDGTILLGELAAPGFRVRMIGAGGFEGTFEGAEGFTSGWLDFLDAFEGLRIIAEEMFESGDTVVDLVRLSARTARGGVPLSTESAAVWHFSEGKLVEVEFHLDREEALRSAGIEPAPD